MVLFSEDEFARPEGICELARIDRKTLDAWIDNGRVDVKTNGSRILVRVGSVFKTPKFKNLLVVYFIQAAEGGLIKIGCTKNLKQRFKAIQNNCPITLKLLAYEIDDNPAAFCRSQLEEKLHKRFASTRCHGEWFEPSIQLLLYIKSLPNEKISE